MTAPIAFLDLETTGLDPHRHEIWEVAIIRRTDAGDDERTWMFEVPLATADAGALRINRYYERISVDETHDDQEDAAIEIAYLLSGAHIVGAVPSFDSGFLEPWLRRHDQAPAWHYHLIDVEALAVGYLHGLTAHQKGAPPPGVYSAAPPWKSHDLTEALGINVSEEDEHTALGDARWARAIYDRVMGGPPS